MNKRNSIQSAYNAWAEQYDTNENKTRDLDHKATIQMLSGYDFRNVIELGCGTGKNTMWLLEKADKITGLDFSEEMLAKAKLKIPPGKAEFKVCDLTGGWAAENLSADLITSSLVLEHIEDLNHVFSQAAKKLKAKGLFFISELHPFKQYTGSKARYQTESGIEELQVFIHHVSDYYQNAAANGFELLELKEWFDNEAADELPRLITLVFRKR